MIISVIQGLVNGYGYQEEMAFHGPNQSVYGERLCSMVQRCCELDFSISPSKCVFSPNSLKFLGHLTDAGGFKPDPDTLLPIAIYTQP